MPFKPLNKHLIYRYSLWSNGFQVHREYLEAGAAVISTASYQVEFLCTYLSMGDFCPSGYQ